MFLSAPRDAQSWLARDPISLEERNMGRLFPDSYPQYKLSTKMLIPFIL